MSTRVQVLCARAVVFGSWFLVMSWLMLRAARRQPERLAPGRGHLAVGQVA